MTSLVTIRNLTVRVRPAGPDVPVFTDSVYLATLTEHSPLATSVVTVSASDSNTVRKAPVKYLLDADVAGEFFLLLNSIEKLEQRLNLCETQLNVIHQHRIFGHPSKAKLVD